MVNSGQNIKRRMFSFRFFTLFFMLIFILDMFLREFRNNVCLLDMQANVAVLPFLQNSDFFLKMILLCVVYFYSDAPFMERGQLFDLIRLGKARWGRRNLSYIMGSALILSVLIAALSILEVLSVGNFSASWDAVYKTLALTGGNSRMSFAIDYQIMTAYSPILLMLLLVVVDWLVFALFGMVMYALSLMGYRTGAAAAAVLLTFLPSMDEMLPRSLVYFSPASWMNCGNWRIGYDNGKPDMAYILVALCFLTFLSGIFCQARVRHMEWKPSDN